MDAAPRIGGHPPAFLRAEPARLDGPALVEAAVAPARGLMLLQAPAAPVRQDRGRDRFTRTCRV
jgi:hypothetical protein